MKPANKLGNKFTCSSCNVRFYDLNKDPAICPTCGNTYVAPKIVVKTRRVGNRSVIHTAN